MNKINKMKITQRKNKNKINLLDMDKTKLRTYLKSIGEKTFRANQIMKWIYQRYCDNFNKMTNIGKNLQKKLKISTKISAPNILDEKHSIDGTIKWIIQINSKTIETVYIPEKNRKTLCISSQIGCPIKCKFCATGGIKFEKNLAVSEIIGQIWKISKLLSKKNKNIKKFKPITNIVVMGMGEPLLNINNIITSINIMLDKEGMKFSKRKITLSTVGISPAIKKITDKIDVVLAISLHAPNNKIRNNIIPINKKYNINSCLNSMKEYIKKSSANKGKATIEYVMLKHINDKIEHAHQLAKLLKNFPCKINLIPWNSFPGSKYKCSSKINIKNFFEILQQYKLTVTIRKTRGSDIYASCGQLIGNIN
ncbi:MAG: 23S rRNA m(2)A2503 methyltransferase/tRNA m(2)A37 methyltransferase [Candidatus Westeberhardia cardiocondylae]|nr:23S rRNA m(2)A2503 methyltransferase/tRNA m(2)A37 methyltransferase [Candidatus Westeberhardia cardiocondylae]